MIEGFRRCRAGLGAVAMVGCVGLLVGTAAAQAPAGASAADLPAPRLMVQSGPRNPMGLALLLSPDKQLLATAGGERSGVYLWQVETGRLLCTLKADMDRDMSFLMQGLPAMAFSIDGGQLATANEDGISVWDLRRCRLQRSLSRRDRPPLTGLLALPDGQVLAADDDGLLHRGRLFAADGDLQPVVRGSQGGLLLHGASRDGRLVLTGGDALRVVDLATGAVDALGADPGAEAGGAGMFGLPRSAALSPSGRWVVDSHLGVATLFDRQAGKQAARVPLTSAAAGPTSPQAAGAGSPGSAPVPLPPEVAAMLKSMPPGEMRTELEKQMRSMMGVVEQAKAAQQAQLGPQGWVGFSAREDRVYFWKNPGPDPQPVIEIRRVPDLSLLASVPVRDPAAVNPLAAGVATSFAASADGSALAVSLITGDMAGGRAGIVDLAQLPTQAVVRAWKPTGSPPGRIAWTPDGQLTAVHGGAMGSGADASLVVRGPTAPGAPAGGPQAEVVFVRWALDSGEVATRVSPTGEILPFAISTGGRYAATLGVENPVRVSTAAGYRLQVVDTQSQTSLYASILEDLEVSRPAGVTGIALSPDGRRVAVLSEASPAGGRSGRDPQRLSLHDTASGRTIAQQVLPLRVAAHGFAQPKMRFSADGRQLLALGERAGDGMLRIELSENGPFKVEPLKSDADLEDLADEAASRVVARVRPGAGSTPLPGLQRIDLPGSDWTFAVSDPSGTRLASAREDRSVQLHTVASDGRVDDGARLQGHASTLVSLAFSPDGRRLASSDEQGGTVIWDVASGALLLRLFAFTDGSWVVVDPAGRFDTNRLEELEYLHWVMPDEPLRALPLDIFMREYFSPGLLGRVMRGEALPAVQSVAALNRAQPRVQIVSVTPSREHPQRVDVTVEAEGRSNAAGRPGGVADLRLFRDGRLVGFPQRPGQALETDPKTGRASVTFRGIRLPQGAESVAFSAYAFNLDRVKSATARSTYTLPAASAARKAQGKAYVIAIGVNSHDNPAFDLRFAVQDARLAAELLAGRLTAGRGYREVVTVPLVSEAQGLREATKARVRAVLAVLAGQPADRAQLSVLPNAGRLGAATPDDLVIITFAGHGHAGNQGEFYLLPQDIPGKERRLDPELLARSISSDELELWLREVDAGETALVIDACHSAASVEGEGFKPGPMGSRGLGQLAYDKGMRVLAASQVDEQAREPVGLKHGLLTYVLLREGLESRRADFKPADRRILLAEWLAYGVQGVPLLERELTGRSPAADADGRSARRPGTGGPRVQQPRLFDFARRGDGPVIEALR